MWLTSGSWLYAKWDFPFEIDRAWSAIRLTQITGAAATDADYNEDGVIDSADYVAWRKLDINGADGYEAWVRSFGEAAGSGGNASQVPEPTFTLLLNIAPVIALARRRGR
jgi:hypothetical protein